MVIPGWPKGPGSKAMITARFQVGDLGVRARGLRPRLGMKLFWGDQKDGRLWPTIGSRPNRRTEHRLQAVPVSKIEHRLPSSRSFAGEGEPGRLVEQSDAEGGGLGRLRAGIGAGHDIVRFR